MDPANPFNNVCFAFSWDEIKEKAENALKRPMLCNVTSTTWLWDNQPMRRGCQKTRTISTSISRQQAKPQKNLKKQKQSNKWTNGVWFLFFVKFLFLFRIVIANPYCNFLLQIHIGHSYWKSLSYIPIANVFNSIE